MTTRAMLLLGTTLLAAAAWAPVSARADDEGTTDGDDASPKGDADDAPDGARPVPPAAELPRTTGMCVDEEIANRLALRRKRRGTVDRLYVKQARHEVSLGGGYYSSDLFSGTYVLGASYAYHMTEQTAVEFGGAWSHANADVVRALEADRARVLDDTFAQTWMLDALLVWSPLYGKLRLGGSVAHFDVHLDAGVGVVDSLTSRGAMGVAGLGLKLFAGRALAVRLDLRNHTFQQELLDERFIVNDVSATLGVSLLLPFRN
jgi:outer membrane beta-barrel protein